MSAQAEPQRETSKFAASDGERQLREQQHQLRRFRNRQLLAVRCRTRRSISASAAVRLLFGTVIGRSTGVLRRHCVGAGRDRSQKASNNEQRSPDKEIVHIGLRNCRSDVKESPGSRSTQAVTNDECVRFITSG